MSIQFLINMKNHLRVLAMAAGLIAPSSFAAGLLSPVGSNLPELELRQQHVEVTVQDSFVTTTVEQVFANPGFDDVDALYSFPVPEGAVVSEFTVWIDGQPVTGEVFEKQKARDLYAQEKAAGRETALAEQKGYQRFELNVSPVRAGQETRIRLQYLQAADISTGIGRYVYALESGGVDEEKLNFWTANEKVTERFHFRLNLRSAYPVDALRAPNISDAKITQIAPGEWVFEIDRRAQNSRHAATELIAETEDDSAGQNNMRPVGLPGNHQAEALTLQKEFNQLLDPTIAANAVSKLDQDIVVYWRLAENLPGSVEMIAHREPGEAKGTFMLTLTPGDDLKLIEEGRDWIFVLDISGSMKGKYSTLAEGIRLAFDRLKSGDRFRIVLFNDQARELTNGWTEISPATVAEYRDKVSAVQPGGGTDLFAGIEKGLRGIDKQRTTGMILVTDGVANVGETQKRGFVKLMRMYDARLFTFIMGNEANRPLLKSIAKESNGFALSISNSDDIVGKIMEATQRMNHQAMHNVKLKLEGVRTDDLTPERIASVYRGQQMIVFGHYWQAGQVRLDLEAEISGEDKSYHTAFNLPERATAHPEIERMWAFAKIQALKDEADLLDDSSDVKQAITGLAVEHGLVTENTSMLVMREEVFRERGIERKNAQRVAKEHKAQQQRAQQPVKSTRVDTAQMGNEPMYKDARPTFSGAGGFDVYWLLLLLPVWLTVAFQTLTRTKRSGK